MNTASLPTIIQGGMGAGVSDWNLARAVSRAGQLGVVAGTALDVILVRRLQDGDRHCSIRRALKHFPIAGVAERILNSYFIKGGKQKSHPYQSLPLLNEKTNRNRQELIVAANFVEVFLSKEGHDGMVGINYLEKIQLPNLPSIFGAMLAGVDVVLMGAGLPKEIPNVLDNFAAGKPASISIDVRGSEPSTSPKLHFDPQALCGTEVPTIARPDFYAIAASATIATVMARKTVGRVDGLIIEGFRAGGHNAPPRGPLKLNADGEPVFSDRDIVNYKDIRKLQLPFWIAGGSSNPEALRAAQAQGAVGVQIGTAFAFCRESGISRSLKNRALRQIQTGRAQIRTDPLASPTGFPFKVFNLPRTMSDDGIFERREKLCDLGYLRHAYAKSDGRIGWRCPGEPTKTFLRKGGQPAETVGRKCVCNGLLANIGLGQIRRTGQREEALLTSGSELEIVARLHYLYGQNYGARDVLTHTLQEPELSASVEPK